MANDVTAFMGVDPALADIRREQAVGFGETKYAISTSSEDTNRDVLTSGYQTQIKIDEAADKLQQQSTDHFIAEQNRDFNTAVEIAKISAAQADLFDRVATYSEINALKTQRYVAEDGDRTRALINDLKTQDLNRQLIERNSDINYWRNDANRWEGLYGNGQFATLASQINALNSNLAETRQGLYNFGTMAGVGQSSTSNQVR
jgi:hypothetical protein